MVLLDGLERLISSFGDDKGRLAMCVLWLFAFSAVTRGKATAHPTLCKVTPWPGIRAALTVP